MNEYVDRLDQVKVTNFIRKKYTINKAKLYMFKKEKQKQPGRKCCDIYNRQILNQ